MNRTSASSSMFASGANVPIARLRRSLRRQAAGFTLIEVIVALVVVGLGMLAVIQTVSQTANTSHYMREKTIAHWVAMNQLTQVRLQPSPPPIDKSSDEVEMAGRDWRWTMEVTQTPVETIRRIEVRVRPSDAPEDSTMAVVTGFYGTAVAPPGSTMLSWQGMQGGPRGARRGQRQRGQDDSESEPPPPQPDLEPGDVVEPEPDPSPNPES